MMALFLGKKYNVIYADPPWQFNNKKTGGSLKSGAAAKYETMSFEDICCIPVWSITADNCVLFLWWVGSMPNEALAVMRSWGFCLKTMTGFDWIKETKHGKLDFGMGHWTRAGSEHCLIATKGKPKRVSASVRSVLHAKKRRHSQKPDEYRDLIVELCGDVPRIEMFAREQAPGWDAWGNEVQDLEFTNYEF